MTKRVALTVLLPYLFLVVISTIVTRRTTSEQHLVLRPFWTIKTILSAGQTKAWLVKEVALNILMLMPVGLLAPVIFEKRNMVKTFLLGVGISVSIEILQLILHRGLAETDDIIFNTFGVIIGIGVFSVVKRRRSNTL